MPSFLVVVADGSLEGSAPLLIVKKLEFTLEQYMKTPGPVTTANLRWPLSFSTLFPFKGFLSGYSSERILSMTILTGFHSGRNVGNWLHVD